MFLRNAIKITLIFLIFSFIITISQAAYEPLPVPDRSLKSQFYENGKQIDERVIGPGLPPPLWETNANAPNLNDATVTMVYSENVPALRWSYGCSATSAAMYFGYYDRTVYPNFYKGLTNSGKFPLDNKVWGYSSENNGECPLSATHLGIDGRTTKGHVDDYYLSYGSTGDPYYGSWTEHSPQDSLGDFMGTNQYQNWQNTDGGTTFFFYTDGSPLNDYTGHESYHRRDGAHGMKLFSVSRGYAVESNYNQYIVGYNGNSQGFSYGQYKEEIDAGNPVFIQVTGHTMLGVGYSGFNQIIVHDTWDYSNHVMTWGGTYSGMTHFGVTVIHLAPPPPKPVIQFVANITTGRVPLTVSFSDQSSNKPNAWTWYFGDVNYRSLWTMTNDSAGWTPRWGQSSIVTPSGSILLMGGEELYYNQKGDVWRSNDQGATWWLVNGSPGWVARGYSTSVVVRDGSILLMGGLNTPNLYSQICYNDVWRTSGNGVIWTERTSNAGWTPRWGHSTVVMPDGSIILMGGGCSGDTNDVWRSRDNGTHWTLINGSAGWTPRHGHTSVVMPDGSIVLMGGMSDEGLKSDVWRSTDNGTKWTRIASNSRWDSRMGHTSVVMPDGSILLMGGTTGGLYFNDVWQSTNYGVTWVKLTGNAGWTPRQWPSSVVMPDSRVVLMGGSSHNDVWQFYPVGSSIAKNPVHTFYSPGNYTVSMRATNNGGSSSLKKVDYIIVQESLIPVANFTAIPRNGNRPLTVQFTDTSKKSPTKWNWKFGDGSSENTTKRNPLHTFNKAGTYTISLKVKNNYGRNTTTRVAYITVGLPPIARFNATSIRGNVPLKVFFRDLSTNTPTKWNWSFGDGSLVNATKQNPIHTYSKVGIYTVSLNATNAYGSNIFTMTGYINVSGVAPVAKFTTSSPNYGILPLKVFFMDTSSNTPTKWNWSFGDGSPENSTIRNPIHTYRKVGTYKVSLNATNAYGSNTVTRTGYIRVGIAPKANFSGTPQTGTAPLAVSFTDLSMNNSPGWAWYFGDEKYTAPWTLVNASSEWSARYNLNSVAMPDGSIVMMGGINQGELNDVWRSTDGGATWSLMNASAGWFGGWGHSFVSTPDGSILLIGNPGETTNNGVWRSTDNGASWSLINSSPGWTERSYASSVVLPDESIVMMGGFNGIGSGIYYNDVWRSTDQGATWMLMNASAGWSARYSHTSVVLPDGSIVLMGGDDGEFKDDVWRSTDQGATWTLINSSAGWHGRVYHCSVVVPDGSIVLLGGMYYEGDYIYKNDMWRSIDNGTTWSEVSSSVAWSPRPLQSCVALKDGSIVMMGGYTKSGVVNDVWRLNTAGASEQNPSHTYSIPGNYTVALQVSNDFRYNNSRKIGYISVNF